MFVHHTDSTWRLNSNIISYSPSDEDIRQKEPVECTQSRPGACAPRMALHLQQWSGGGVFKHQERHLVQTLYVGGGGGAPELLYDFIFI